MPPGGAAGARLSRGLVREACLLGQPLGNFGVAAGQGGEGLLEQVGRGKGALEVEEATGAVDAVLQAGGVVAEPLETFDDAGGGVAEQLCSEQGGFDAR